MHGALLVKIERGIFRMNSKEIQRKIQNIERAMTTMNEMLSDLKKQQTVLMKQEAERHEMISQQKDLKQQTLY